MNPTNAKDEYGPHYVCDICRTRYDRLKDAATCCESLIAKDDTSGRVPNKTAVPKDPRPYADQMPQRRESY